MRKFLKKAFNDMKESAREQHQVDKANFAAAKAESRAQWEEAKMSPAGRREKQSSERMEQLAAANERIAAAGERIEYAKERKGFSIKKVIVPAIIITGVASAVTAVINKIK